MLTKSMISAIGLTILILVQPIGMFMNYFISPSGWTNIMAAVGCVFICNYKELFYIKLPSQALLLNSIIAFQFFCLIYILLSPRSVATVFWGSHMCTICFCFAMLTNRNLPFSIYQFHNILQIISSLLVILCYTVIKNGNFSTEGSNPKQDSDILEAFTISAACVINFIVSLLTIVQPSKQLWIKILAAVSMTLGFYCALYGTKRTPVLVMIIAALLIMIKYHRLTKKQIIHSLLCATPIIIIVTASVGLNTLGDLLDRFYENTVLGVNDIATGSNSDFSGSATTRFVLRKKAWEFFDKNINVVTAIFGNGYNSLGQIDNQLIQVFIEMGVLGAVAVGASIVIPVYTFINNKTRTTNDSGFAVQLSSLLCLYQSVCFYNSGSPYMFLRWIPFSFFAYCIYKEKRSSSKTPHTTV